MIITFVEDSRYDVKAHPWYAINSYSGQTIFESDGKQI